jgi:hypothetical protein
MEDKIFRKFINESVRKTLQVNTSTRSDIIIKIYSIQHDTRQKLERFFDKNFRWYYEQEGWTFWWACQVLLTLSVCRYYMKCRNYTRLEANVEYLDRLLYGYDGGSDYDSKYSKFKESADKMHVFFRNFIVKINTTRC